MPAPERWWRRLAQRRREDGGQREGEHREQLWQVVLHGRTCEQEPLRGVELRELRVELGLDRVVALARGLRVKV